MLTYFTHLLSSDSSLILKWKSREFANKCEQNREKVKILKLKCTQFDIGWGFAPNPAWGAYSAPPDPLARFKGA